MPDDARAANAVDRVIVRRVGDADALRRRVGDRDRRRAPGHRLVYVQRTSGRHGGFPRKPAVRRRRASELESVRRIRLRPHARRSESLGRPFRARDGSLVAQELHQRRDARIDGCQRQPVRGPVLQTVGGKHKSHGAEPAALVVNRTAQVGDAAVGRAAVVQHQLIDRQVRGGRPRDFDVFVAVRAQGIVVDFVDPDRRLRQVVSENGQRELAGR